MLAQFSGNVIHGLKNGRKIGYRTANIELNSGVIPSGTYMLHGIIGKEVYFGVGAYREEKGLFEAHFLDFHKNIYGKSIEIIVLAKIRENRKFSSLEEIKEQISEDIKQAKKTKIVGMTFGTFEILHKGHQHYLNEAKKYCTFLITVIARDINVKKIKGSIPQRDEKERKNAVEELGISDKVVLGDKLDPLKWIKKFSPSVICLGYDQTGFLSLLEKSDLQIKPQIIRMTPFKEYLYKSSLLKKTKNKE